MRAHQPASPVPASAPYPIDMSERSPMTPRRTRVLLAAALVLVVAACGGDDDAADSATTAPTTTAAATTTAAPATTAAPTSTTAAPTTTTAAPTTTTAAPTTTVVAAGGTLYDELSGEDNLTFLVAAIDAAGLEDDLASPDATLTVFAPTNDAFAAALTDLGLTEDELLADTATLATILTYHVLGQTVTSADIAAAGTEDVTYETIEGQDLVVVVGDAGNVTFLDQSATVVAADGPASNGVFHIIDAVLIPPTTS